jgi:hypothetical protein
MPYRQLGGRRYYRLSACEAWNRNRAVATAAHQRLAAATNLAPTTVEEFIHDLASAVLDRARAEFTSDVVEQTLVVLRPMIRELTMEAVRGIAAALSEAAERETQP